MNLLAGHFFRDQGQLFLYPVLQPGLNEELQLKKSSSLGAPHGLFKAAEISLMQVVQPPVILEDMLRQRRGRRIVKGIILLHILVDKTDALRQQLVVAVFIGIV